ncbi:MAG: hypothetical protein R3247_17755, partial [Rhodothermales bacterium]|nr:hypothetical protein [Rhodothermales bacterium]
MTPEGWARIQALFDAALDRAPETRSAFLDAACAGEADLRREVESLLDAFEEHGPVDALASEIVAPLIQPAAQVGGQRVGPYRLGRELGHGGMGAVYLAERADGEFDQRVAIKVVRERLGRP